MYYIYELKKNNKKNEPYAVGSILQFLSHAYTFFEERSAFSKTTLTPAVYLKLWGNWSHGIDGVPPRPIWYSSFRDAVRRVYNESYITNELGDVTGDFDPDLALEADELGRFCKKFLTSSSSSSSKHEDRLLLLLLYHAAGRGGELKHLMLAGRRGLRWDRRFKCLVLMWKETKVIRHYPLAIITHASSYQLCTVHAFAVFAAFGGFGRTNQEGSRAWFLAQTLQKKKNNSVAPHISNLLPTGVSSRGLRVTAITDMHLSPETTDGDVNRRTGHAGGPGNNTDKYYRPSTHGSYAGGTALAGYTKINGVVTPATLPEEIIRELGKNIGVVFPFVTFSAFTDEDGMLAPVLEMLLASLFHRWDEMLGDNLTPTNCDIMNHLLKAVMTVESIDARQALFKLGEWSKTIDKNFVHNNAIALGLGNNNGDMAEYIKTTTAVMLELLSEVKSLKSQLAEVKRGVENVSSDVQVAACSPAPANAGKRPASPSASSSSEASRMFLNSAVDISMNDFSKSKKLKV